MFEKTKLKIKLKLMEWLEIDSNFKTTILKIDNLERKVNAHDRMRVKSQKEQNGKIELLHKTVENVVAIGTNVAHPSDERSGSWAVVCIEGKYNVVKFVDLHNHKYARDILDYLKRYEGGRHTIDSPNWGKLFEDEFVWMK